MCYATNYPQDIPQIDAKSTFFALIFHFALNFSLFLHSTYPFYINGLTPESAKVHENFIYLHMKLQEHFP